MKKKSVFILVGLVLALAACVPGQQQSLAESSSLQAPENKNPAGEEDGEVVYGGSDLKSPASILMKFESAVNAGDLDAIMALCAEDVIFGSVESSKWTDMEANWGIYIRDKIGLAFSNIQEAEDRTILELAWFMDGQFITHQRWEATFEAGKIKTLVFLEEMPAAGD